MIDLDNLYTFRDVAELIRKYGPDDFLKDFYGIYPQEAKALSNAVLHEHANEYDKKKAALLQRVPTMNGPMKKE